MAVNGFTLIEHFANGYNKREELTPELIHRIMAGKMTANVVLTHERFGRYVGYISRVAIKPPRHATLEQRKAFLAQSLQVPLVVVGFPFSKYRQIWHLGADGAITRVAETSAYPNVDMDVFRPVLAKGLIDWRNYGHCDFFNLNEQL